MDDKANVDLIRQCYNYFLQGDMEQLLSHMTEDIQWELPQIEGVPFSGKRHGIQQVAEFFQQVGEAQTPLEFHPGEFVAQGDRVVVFGRYNWALKSTGAEFTSDFVHAFKLRHGKVCAFHEYLDTHVVVEAYRSRSDLGAGGDPSRLPSKNCPSIH